MYIISNIKQRCVICIQMGVTVFQVQKEQDLKLNPVEHLLLVITHNLPDCCLSDRLIGSYVASVTAANGLYYGQINKKCHTVIF